MILQLLPKIPLAARVALLHILHISPQSKYLDLTTEVTIAVLRSFLVPSKPMSITQTQKLVNRDPGIKGRIWVANYTAPASPGSGIRDALIRAINGLQEGSPLPSELLDRLPDAGPVEAEWTGYRGGVPGDAKLPPTSEQEKYTEMMKEVKTPITVLYCHGGAYYLMDPCTHRPATKKLARETGGRCYSVRYRLAPQHPFPAAVMDALTSYLTLLHPPPDAFHSPVKPEHIIFAGDSAGGNLALALLQTILELNRQAASTPGQTIHWHGVDIPLPLPLPAGIQVTSPWLDMTHSSPSCHGNAAYDYLPALNPHDRPSPPPCPVWPASPPRKNLYVADELAAHPLVTLLMARSWAGAPPVYMSTGWELLADEDKLLAAKLHGDGVRVVFEEYEAMPHCFALMFKDLEESKRCWRGMTDFIKEVAGGEGGKAQEKGESSFTTVKARTLEEVPIEVGKLAAYEEGVMRERISNQVKKGVEVGGFDETVAKL
ncbi:acetyl-hydrolase-like protein [Coniochaeta sp. 2T2.1]|nr:acetyl-hydrolase-like protein [Coniochaeta sp. 2T2.1]